MEDERILIGLDLSLASMEVIEVLLDDPSDPGIFEEIASANANRLEILQMVALHENTPESVKTMIAGKTHIPVKAEEKEEPVREAKPQNLMLKIQQLSVAQRIQLAMRGGAEIRRILVKDTNKEVMLSVLENQKITEGEVEMIARSRSVPEEALRRIAKNREWMKSYAVTFALVTNAKTPAGIAITLVSQIRTKDLTILEKNKNVSEAVRSAAKKLVSARRPR